MPSDSDAGDRDAIAPQARVSDGAPTPSDACEVCGSTRVVWRRCKLVCENCRTILKSCADL